MIKGQQMYGIILIGVNWVVIKLVITGKWQCNDINNNGNVDVLLSTRSLFALPINEIEFDEKHMCNCLGKSNGCS